MNKFDGMRSGEIINQIIGDYDLQPINVNQASGALSYEEINHWLDEMFAHARSNPGTLLVSPEDFWRVRFAWFYGQHRLPKRKLRKCFLRKRQGRIKQGRRQLQRRREREQKKMGASHRELVDAIIMEDSNGR